MSNEKHWMDACTRDDGAVFGRRIHTARKDYACDWQGCDECGGIIKKGDRYMKESGDTNIGVVTQRYCAACMDDLTKWMEEK